MKLDQPLDSDWTLYNIDSTLQQVIIYVALLALQQPKGQPRIKKVVTNFHAFVNAFKPDYLHGKEDQLSKNFAMALATDTTTYDFFDFICTTVDEDSREDAIILFQNALTYAIAKEFRYNIPRRFMRVQNPVPGTVKATHADIEYEEYIKTFHPDVAKFVTYNNKLFSKKILAIMGYMINPTLEEEH